MVSNNKKVMLGVGVWVLLVWMGLVTQVSAAVSISVTEQNPVQAPSVNSFLGTQKNDFVSFSMFQNSTTISDTLDLSLFVEMAAEDITTTTPYNLTFKVSTNADLASSVTARAAGNLSAIKKKVGYTIKVTGLAPSKKYYAQLVDTQYKMETPITNFTTSASSSQNNNQNQRGGDGTPLPGDGDPLDGDGKPLVGDGTDPQGNGNVSVVEIVNPINVDSIQGFMEKVLGVLMKIAIPLIGFFIIYAGFKFVLAQGNAEKLEAAKRTFLYTLIGAALLLGAWGIASIVSSTIEALTK